MTFQSLYDKEVDTFRASLVVQKEREKTAALGMGQKKRMVNPSFPFLSFTGLISCCLLFDDHGCHSGNMYGTCSLSPAHGKEGLCAIPFSMRSFLGI